MKSSRGYEKGTRVRIKTNGDMGTVVQIYKREEWNEPYWIYYVHIDRTGTVSMFMYEQLKPLLPVS